MVQNSQVIKVHMHVLKHTQIIVLQPETSVLPWSTDQKQPKGGHWKK